MPPHQHSPNEATETYEDNLQNENRKEQLKQFSNYCRFYYRDALSLQQTITSSDRDVNNLDEEESRIFNSNERRETCRAVLQAFESLCASRKVPPCNDELYRPAITRCGLLDSEFLMGEQGKLRLNLYTKVRDVERRSAHEHLMYERRSHFFELLEEKEREIIEPAFSPSSHGFLLNFQQWEIDGKKKHVVRKFSKAYSSKVGVHPWLAGLKKLFETQLENTDRVTKWEFDIASLTENCSGDDALLHDALALITTFLVREILEGSNEEKRDEFFEAPTTAWKIRENISINLMKKILSILPHSRELHAKPTGRVIVSNEKRKVEETTFLETWCVVQ